MGSSKDAVSALDFNNSGEMWFTECVLYICLILIWYLLCKVSWHFCIKKGSPKFTQFNQRALKPIKKAAEESRMRRQSEYEQTQTQSRTATHTSNGSTINSTMTATSTIEPQNGRQPTISTTATSTLKSSSNNNRRSHDRSKSMSIPDETPEEFQLQICKIHRNLRVCFVTSLCCTAIAITSIMLNHTLIISGAIDRDCTISRLPVAANFCQRVALYTFFIFRLHYSFRGTQYGIKPIFIYILMATIFIIGGGAVFYFFLILSLADDPCASDLPAKAGGPAVGQDQFWNILLSVLFLIKLGSAVKSQNKFRMGSTRNLDKANLKKARSSYKYYYTMYKLTCLFVVAAIITLTLFIILFYTGLGSAMSSIDSVASNYLLYLSFQFNDHYFRIVFCACLELQTKFLGEEYAKEMDLHFLNQKKPPHRQSSRTWNDDKVETMNDAPDKNKIHKIEEGDEEEEETMDNNNNLDVNQTDVDNTATNEYENKGDDGNKDKVAIIVTPDQNDGDGDDEPEMNRINTVDSSVDMSNTSTGGLPQMTPVDTNITVFNENVENYQNVDIENDNDLQLIHTTIQEEEDKENEDKETVKEEEQP